MNFLGVLISTIFIVNTAFANGWSSLHYAIYNSDRELVNRIIKENKDILNIESKAGITPLHLAVKLRKLDIVKSLIEAGVDIDAQDKNGQSALHYAVAQRLKKIIYLLIKSNIDIDAQNRFGITALHQASFSNAFDIVEILLIFGADVHIKNIEGLTAYDIARLKKNIGIVSDLEPYMK